MQAFLIDAQKEFMSALLAGTSFDSFIVCSVQVTTFTTFTVDGSWHPEFAGASAEDQEAGEKPESSSLTWRMVRPAVYSLIRGKTPPLQIKAVLRLSDENTQKVLAQAGLPLSPQDVTGLYLNILYDREKITLTAGTSLRVFTPDRTLDQVWGDLTGKFLSKLQITYEKI